jgi:hypothetical protein
MHEIITNRSPSPYRGWAHTVSEICEATRISETSAAAIELELEAFGWRNQRVCDKGQVEGQADVQPHVTREAYVPVELPTMGELLRQQHAVCKQNRPSKPVVHTYTHGRDVVVKCQASDGVRSEASRTWGLFLRRVCKLLEEGLEIVSGSVHLRVHTPKRRFTDWTRRDCAEFFWSVDTMERRRRTDERQYGHCGQDS